MASQSSVESNPLAQFVTSTDISELMKNATGRRELQSVDDVFSVNTNTPTSSHPTHSTNSVLTAPMSSEACSLTSQSPLSANQSLTSSNIGTDSASRNTTELRVTIKAPENADRALLNRTVEQHVQRLAEEGKITGQTQVLFVVEKSEPQPETITTHFQQPSQASSMSHHQQQQQAQERLQLSADGQQNLMQHQLLLQRQPQQPQQVQQAQPQQQTQLQQPQQSSQQQQVTQQRVLSTSSVSGVTMVNPASGSPNLAKVVLSQPNQISNTPLRVFYTQRSESTATPTITSGGTPLQIRTVRPVGSGSGGVQSTTISPSDLLRLIQKKDSALHGQQQQSQAQQQPQPPQQPQQQQPQVQQQSQTQQHPLMTAASTHGGLKIQLNTAKLAKRLGSQSVVPLTGNTLNALTQGTQVQSNEQRQTTGQPVSQPSIVLMAGSGQEQRVIPISQLKLLAGGSSASSTSGSGNQVSFSSLSGANTSGGSGTNSTVSGLTGVSGLTNATTQSGKQVILLQCGSGANAASSSANIVSAGSIPSAVSAASIRSPNFPTVIQGARSSVGGGSSGVSNAIGQPASTHLASSGVSQVLSVLNSSDNHPQTLRNTSSPDSSIGSHALATGVGGGSSRGGGNLSPWQQYVKQFQAMEPCPICGDRVSGYHYGIFCCESCKGFFKRTVQNHRSYACHRGPNDKPCDINTASRKKCPACRFRRCISKGMRVEAIRLDRQRGGRSMYPGARTRSVIRSAPPPVQPPAGMTTTSGLAAMAAGHKDGFATKSDELGLQRGAGTAGMMPGGAQQQQGTSGAGGMTAGDQTAPQPQIYLSKVLTEIVSVERLVAFEEDRLEFSSPREGEEEEAAVYRALLDLADQRLYRLVRWSRALPEFSYVDTDDQIALLQNCWSELLCLDCCWRSLSTPQEIRLTANKCINLDAARELGAATVVNLILTLTADMHRLQVDLAEYASLKVILLMQPDIPGLKAVDRVRGYQESVSQSLMKYTQAKFPHITDKFSAMLVRLPELGRVSGLARDMLLKQDLTPYLKSSSLLMELLRSDREAQSSQSTSGGPSAGASSEGPHQSV